MISYMGKCKKRTFYLRHLVLIDKKKMNNKRETIDFFRKIKDEKKIIKDKYV